MTSVRGLLCFVFLKKTDNAFLRMTPRWCSVRPLFAVINGTCEACPVGQWKTSNDTSEFCSSCPAGRTTTGIATPYEVNCTIECGLNMFVDFNNGLCVPCEAGLFAFYGSRACCVPGSYSSRNLEDDLCTGCPEGTYGNAGTNYACWPCPAGRFTNTTGNTACSLCPAGTDSLYGGSSCTLCKQGKPYVTAQRFLLHTSTVY